MQLDLIEIIDRPTKASDGMKLWRVGGAAADDAVWAAWDGLQDQKAAS